MCRTVPNAVVVITMNLNKCNVGRTKLRNARFYGGFRFSGFFRRPSNREAIKIRIRQLIIYVVVNNIFLHYVRGIAVSNRRELCACFNLYRINRRAVISFINLKAKRIRFAPNLTRCAAFINFSKRIILRFRGIYVDVIQYVHGRNIHFYVRISIITVANEQQQSLSFCIALSVVDIRNRYVFRYGIRIRNWLFRFPLSVY